MDWWLYLKGALFLFGLIAGPLLIAFGIRLLKGDKGDYEANRERSKSISRAVFGEVEPHHAGYRDYRVQAGLAVDKKTNSWKFQGALSEEAVDSVLRKRRKWR